MLGAAGSESFGKGTIAGAVTACLGDAARVPTCTLCEVNPKAKPKSTILGQPLNLLSRTHSGCIARLSSQQAFWQYPDYRVQIVQVESLNRLSCYLVNKWSPCKLLSLSIFHMRRAIRVCNSNSRLKFLVPTDS